MNHEIMLPKARILEWLAPRRGLVLVLVGVLAGVGASLGVARLRPALTAAQSSSPASEVLAPLETVTALGRLEPRGKIIRLSAPSAAGSNRVASLLVKEGDRVRAGQVIAILDSQERLQTAVEEARAQVASAQAKLAQVKAGYQAGTINAQSAEVARLQADLVGNEAEQREVIARLEAQIEGDRASQSAAVKRLRAETDIAQREYDRYAALHQQGAVSDSLLDSKRLTLSSAQQQLREAEAVLARTIATNQRLLSEASARLQKIVAAGEEQVSGAEANLDRVLEVRPEDVATAEAEVQRTIAARQQAEVNLAAAQVRSPQEGVILTVLTRPGETIGENGIVEMGQTQSMYAVAEVYQSDIQAVKIGKKVTITSDSLSESLHGTVDWIDAKVQRQEVINADPATNIDARIVEVYIRLNADASRQAARYSNLQVKAVIER